MSYFAKPFFLLFGGFLLVGQVFAAPIVPPGKRGYLVRVSTPIGSNVQPGDHLDVFVTYGGPKGETNKLLLSDVVCVQHLPIREKEGGVNTTLILDLNPMEAEQLAVAQGEQHAKISVAPAHARKKQINNDEHNYSPKELTGT